MADYLKTLAEDQPPPTPYFEKDITMEGEIIDVQIDWNYKRDKRRSVVGFISVITDITERKRAEEDIKKTKDHLDNIIESSLDAIIVTDDMGYITRVNPSFLQLLGYREEEVIGKHMIECAPMEEGYYESTTGELIHINEKFYDSMKNSMNKLLEDGKVINRETYYFTKDKKVVHVEDSLVFRLFNRICGLKLLK
ncbi:MAG: PAS domain S-box protein [Deltaproteobacteria bacterium]|nr:PAS domain S-box protein [Deltaproteobacteria bacterium]